VQELDESANHPSLDDLFDRRVALLRQELSELCGGLDLKVDLIREDPADHLGEILVQLRHDLSVSKASHDEAPTRIIWVMLVTV
jgi:hypothetical protein